MDLEVDRSAFGRTRLVQPASTPVSDDITDVPDGTVLLRIGSFAVTANNVTYAVAGDLIGYWQFFPGSGDGWGRVPAWGHADVEVSSCEGVDVGERFFGFLPMSTHLVVRPGRGLRRQRRPPRRPPRGVQPLPAVRRRRQSGRRGARGIAAATVRNVVPPGRLARQREDVRCRHVELGGPEPEFFFAPDHAERHAAEWGPGGAAERLDSARAEFARVAQAWIEIDRRHGPDAIADAWTEAVDGSADPRKGVICSW